MQQGAILGGIEGWRGRIKNEGEADLRFASNEGNSLEWTFQIAEVNKVLASVSALVDTNHRVVFDKDKKTGADISFITDNPPTSAPKCIARAMLG